MFPLSVKVGDKKYKIEFFLKKKKKEKKRKMKRGIE
jgi:hypothetical protein